MSQRYKFLSGPVWTLEGEGAGLDTFHSPGRKNKGWGSGGILHHVEHCVQSHCPKQQVAMKGFQAPIVTALTAGERSVHRQDYDP